MTSFFCTLKIYLKQSIQLLINREKIGTIKSKNSKAFIDYLETFVDDYESLEGCNPINKRKMLIFFDDMIADMEANKKCPIVTELFLQ